MQTDCQILSNGFPTFDSVNCCIDSSVGCLDGRIVSLTLAAVDGSVTPEFGGLTQLTRITTIGVPVDFDFTSTLDNLVEIDIRNTGPLHPFPTGLRGKLSLERIYLRDAVVGELPDWVCELTELTELSLWKNQLSGDLPECLGSLEKMKKMDFSNNLFTGALPETIGDMTQLAEFMIGFQDSGQALSNQYSGSIPASFSKMTDLVNIDLRSLELTGPLPNMTQMTSLTNCEFYPSQICYIPDSLPPNTNCRSKVTEFLPVCSSFSNDCQVINDWLPEHFDDTFCCESEEITCESNRIVGISMSNFQGGNVIVYIPNALRTLDQLVQLDVSNNQIAGTIATSSVLDIQSIETLNLAGNRLSGIIPSPISTLVNLKFFYMQDNLLGGPIPSSLNTITGLQRVNVSGNLASISLSFIPEFELILYMDERDNHTSSGTQQEQELNQGPDVISIGPEDGGDSTVLIAATTAVSLVVMAGLAVTTLGVRRKIGKTSDFELTVYPKYASSNKKIRLIKEMASGGFGTVWKAKYKKQIVAVKLINMKKRSGNDGSDAMVTMLKSVVDEASVMISLRHPRIVQILGFEVESLAIILEYMEHGSLYSYIRNVRQKMPWAERYQMMLDICEGMSYLHSSKGHDGFPKPVLYHQDLKSGNVLLSKEDGVLRAKISDFGLSLLKKSTTAATELVSINGGTKCYQAPELLHRGAKFSKKADVFAAGIVFLELLTLRSPVGLYEKLWPALLELELPQAFKDCFSGMLDADPRSRKLFDELYTLLVSDDGLQIKEMKLALIKGNFNEVMADINSLMGSEMLSSYAGYSGTSAGLPLESASKSAKY